MKIELHLIQNFAPSCLNRDENNAPKDCTFGGVRRARISSQCIKRSVREFWNASSTITPGKRTKRIKGEIAKAVRSRMPNPTDEEITNVTELFVSTYYAGADGKNADKTNVLLYVGQPEIEVAAESIVEVWDEAVKILRENAETLAKGSKNPKLKALTKSKDIAANLKSATPSADIALFGRMLAENPDMKTDAACQVAHAISTHKVDMDMDFYTAVDDLNPDEETGAGMMGVTGFNSACFYRYACVDLDDLAKNLGDRAEAIKVTKAFLKASVMAIPTGKQNSMAAQNRPLFGMFVVRESGVPMSLANAFQKPVRVNGVDNDLVSESVKALIKHWNDIATAYGDDGVLATSGFLRGWRIWTSMDWRRAGRVAYRRPLMP